MINKKWILKTQMTHSGRNRYGLDTEADFSYVINYERIRADRNQSYYSVVYLIINAENNNENALRSLIENIKKHMRSIDYMGWQSEFCLGIILPQTDYDGAVQFKEHLKVFYNDIDLDDKIITYPDKNKTLKPHNSGKSDLLFRNFSPSIPLWKRVLDLLGATTGLVLFSPVIIFLPLYIKLVSPGPVFYSQTRVGFRGREFRFWKFRTMHVDTRTKVHNDYLIKLIKSDSPMIKLDDKNDPRIIPGGKVLRKACLDEIPQFFNILKGDMSLVGPRPCLPYEAKEFLQWHKYRFDINPGLTGLWQVSGKNKLTFRQMLQLDIQYSRNISCSSI